MSDRCRLLTVYLGVFLNVSLHGATYFVTQHHPQASDENPGTVDRPWKTISKAVTTIAPGAVVIIGDGVYRESIIVKSGGTAQSPIRFESASGAHVVLTGADQLFGWKKSDERRPVYEISWTHRFNTWSKNMTHPDDDYHRVIGRCEQVAIQNYLLHQVLERDQLSPGSFFADIANQKLVVWDIAGRDLNRGNGLWLDIGNENCAVKQCLIADNEDSGIFYEISYGLHAYDNVIMANGFAATPGAWGAQAGHFLIQQPGLCYRAKPDFWKPRGV